MKISEERMYVAEFAANPYLMTVHGPEVVGAHQRGFTAGIEFCKKEIVSYFKEKLDWYESIQKLPCPEIVALKEIIEDLEKEG